MKDCTKCGQSYALSPDFWHRDKNRPDGLDKHCKTCKAERRKTLYERNAEAEKALVGQWRLRNPDRKRSQHTTRRARKITNGPVDNISYFLVFHTDNGVCGLCFEDVDWNLKWPDKLCGTLDHIIPLSKGGSHTYRNVQLAHASCNSSKGNRYEDDLRATG